MAKPNIPQDHNARKLAKALLDAAHFDSVELSTLGANGFFVIINVQVVHHFSSDGMPPSREQFLVDGRGYKLMKRRKFSNGENG